MRDRWAGDGDGGAVPPGPLPGEAAAGLLAQAGRLRTKVAGLVVAWRRRHALARSEVSQTQDLRRRLRALRQQIGR